MFCVNCGSKLPDEAKFCMTCGQKIEYIPHLSSENQKSNIMQETAESTVPTIVVAQKDKPIEFVILGNTIQFPGSYRRYTDERQRFANSFNLSLDGLKKNANKKYAQTFESDKDKCIQVVSDFGGSVISWTYDWAIAFLINHNIYDISKERLANMCEGHWAQFYNFYNQFEEGYLALIATKEEMEEYRRLRRASRGHWEGGGFGLGGALKGAAMAGVLNAGGSIISGIGSAIGNAIDSGIINRDKKKYLTERKWINECAISLGKSSTAIYHEVYCLVARRVGWEIPPIDAVAGQAYLENSPKAVGKEKQITIILNGLLQNPFSLRGLKMLLSKGSELELELCRFVEFFTPSAYWNACYQAIWESFSNEYERISRYESFDSRINYTRKEFDFLKNNCQRTEFLKGYSSKYWDAYQNIYHADEQSRRTSSDGIVHKTVEERDIYEKEYRTYNAIKKKAVVVDTIFEKLEVYREAKEYGFHSNVICVEINECFENYSSMVKSKKCVAYLREMLNESKKTGLQNIINAAKSGDADAIFVLADLHLQGKIISKDEEKAFRLFSLASQKDHVEASAHMGYCYLTGAGIEENYVKAYELLSATAKKGSAYAQARLGVLLLSVDASELGLTDKEVNTEAGLMWLRTAANQEDAEAQCILARCYSRGEWIEKNYDQALIWYQKSAEKGYAPAYCDLAMLYKEGLGVEQDIQETITLLEKAVALDDDSEIQLELAQEYKNIGRLKDALAIYTVCAKNGNGKAYRKIAQMYQKGLGLPQDMDLAIKWFKAGAEKGDGHSQWSLGRIYMEGIGVSQDYTESIKWLRKGAESNYDACQYLMGHFFEKGLGVPQSYDEAIKWYLLGAENDNTECMQALGRLYKKGNGVSKDPTTAVEWFKRGAENENTGCQYALGQMYQYGEGVFQSTYEAVKWYRMGADAGDADCQTALARLYQEGKGVTQDYQRAKELYVKAIEQGNSVAMNNLALMFENGQGGPKDHKTAMKLLQLAIDAGNKGAAENYKKIKRIFD